MKNCILLFCFTLLGVSSAFAQTADSKDKKSNQPQKVAAQTTIAKTVLIKPDSTPLELVKAALQAHGGDKFKTMKSLTEIGSADVSAPGSTQSLSVGFKLITAGEKFRFEINAPFGNLQQVYDGQNLSSTSSFGNAADIPPLSKLGINLLNKAEEKGYTVSALPDKKKRRGFRIATPDGYATDFYLDATTGLVMSYEAKFTVRDREVSTAVEHDKFREVEGVLIPEKFSQRFDIGSNTFYASFKAKEILVNTIIADDVFLAPQ
ncbi:MAG: hypothetical protein ABI954_03545 [Pyrinomonadaceae bacterium]